MQPKSFSDAGEDLTRTGADCAPAPIFETILIDGWTLDELALKLIAMSLPNAFVPLLTIRLGEIPPLKKNSDVLVAFPCWNSLSANGSISYQRTSEPAPPATVCWVQMATRPLVP